MHRRLAAALPVVLFALTMASALAVGGAYISRNAAASARLFQRATELHPPAETALVNAVVAWDSAARAAQPVGSTTAIAPTDTSSASAEVWITRATVSTYWLVAESRLDLRPKLRRRVGLMVGVRTGRPVPVPQRPWAQLP
jgi:hypothetical protein